MSADWANIEIKLAQTDDAESISMVLAEAFAEYKSFYTEEAFAATTPSSERVKTDLDEGAAWIALLDGKAVGTVSVIPKNEGLYIRGMAILPAARGNKIGEKLLSQIENFAAEQGFRRLFLSTTPFLARAIRLYENFGFRRNQETPHELFGTPLFTMEKEIGLTLSPKVHT